jgi:hypothetical protein
MDPQVISAGMQRQDTGTHCRVYWGSHGCMHLRGHDPGTPHACDCCECPVPDCKPSCVAKPPYYGPETRFYGEDAEALGLPGYRPVVSAHEVVIRFGRPFDIHTNWGAFLADVREITVPFADRESAEGAQREITVSVRPVHDAGGEDYRPVVPGEVIRQAAEIESGER